MRPFGDGVINAYVPAIQLHTRRFLFCLDCILDVLHVHESKPSGSTGVMVVDQLQVVYGSISLKDFTNVAFLRAKAQTKDTQTTALTRMIPVTHVSTPA